MTVSAFLFYFLVIDNKYCFLLFLSSNKTILQIAYQYDHNCRMVARCAKIKRNESMEEQFVPQILMKEKYLIVTSNQIANTHLRATLNLPAVFIANFEKLQKGI